MLQPLPFLAYINDLPDHVSSLLYMYANGVKCSRHISSYDNGNLLQADVNYLCSWAKQWRMNFKVSNCAVLQCITGKIPLVTSEYEFNGVVVKTYNTYKDPGVFISADLSFTTHYNHITSRAYILYVGVNQADFHDENKYPGKDTLVHQPGTVPTTILLGSVATKCTQRY